MPPALLALIPTLAPTVVNAIASLIRTHPDTTDEQRRKLDAAFGRADDADAVWKDLAPGAPGDPTPGDQ